MRNSIVLKGSETGVLKSGFQTKWCMVKAVLPEFQVEGMMVTSRLNQIKGGIDIIM